MGIQGSSFVFTPVCRQILAMNELPMGCDPRYSRGGRPEEFSSPDSLRRAVQF
jgi:hypothetical protein